MHPTKYTLVIGEPRSGTSLMMQTLQLLGAPIAGTKYPGQVKLATALAEQTDSIKAAIQRRMLHHMEMNPVGFYEIPGVVIRGISLNVPELQGKAFKVMSTGFVRGTDKTLIDKVILCIRNPRSVVVSQQGLSDNILVAGDEGWDRRHRSIMPENYVRGQAILADFLVKHPAAMERLLVVDYGAVQGHPQECVSVLNVFLGLNASFAQKKAAFENIQPDLNRSKPIDRWPDHLRDAGRLADKFYEALKLRDLEQLTALVELAKGWARTKALEAATWADTEQGTFATTNPGLERMFRTNHKGVASILRSNVDHLRFTDCRFVGNATKEYMIERPVDLGHLVRPLVACGRDKDEKTWEQCKRCWTQGWIVDGKQVGPQRESN